MQTVVTMLETLAVFSDDRVKRYLLRKTWDKDKPKLAVIMLAPSEASGIELDSTTLLVLNNASRLGYGRVDILNLFATLNDFSLKQAEDADQENITYIVNSAKEVDDIVYCAGVGKAKNKTFIRRQAEVILALRPFEDKLKCLTNTSGNARLQHPLSPAVRVWKLSPLTVSELVPSVPKEEAQKEETASSTTAKDAKKRSKVKG